MSQPASPLHRWTDRNGAVRLLGLNIAGEYVAIGVNVALGLVVLPFNVAHLGQSTRGFATCSAFTMPA
jgi:hypothetical protein